MADKNLGNLYYSLGLDDTEFTKKMSAALQKYEDGIKKTTPSVNMNPIIQTYEVLEKVSTSAAKRMRETMEENVPAFRKVDDRLIQLNRYYKELEKSSARVASEQSKVASAQANGQFKEYIKSLTATSDELKAMSTYYRELEKSSAKAAAQREKASKQGNGRFKEYIAGLTTTSSEQKAMSAYYRELEKNSAAIDKYVRQTRKISPAQKNMRKEFELTNKTLLSTRTLSIQLSNQLGTMFSIYAAQGWVRQLVQARGEFELQEVALKAILRNGKAAEKIFAQVKDLAIVSPFEFKDLISYTKQLSAFSVPVEELYGTMKSLADISSGLGVDMSRLVLAYGQVRSAAVLRGQELRQFTEAGIPLVDELAKKFTQLEGRVVSAGDVFDKISKRMVSFEMVKDIMFELTSVGGQFYEMQKKQAETLRGKVANLADAYAIMLNDIGEANEGLLKGGVDVLYSLINNWEEVAKAIKAVVLGYGTYKAMVLSIIAIEKLNTASSILARTTAMVNLIRVTQGLTAATKAQIVAQKALNVIQSINPYYAVATAIGVAVGAMILYSEKVETAEEAHARYNKELAETENSLNKLVSDIKGYYKIATDEEQATLRRIQALQELQRLYPAVFKNMDLEALKLANIRDVTESVTKKELARNTYKAKEELRLAKSQLDDLKRMQDEYANYVANGGRGTFGQTGLYNPSAEELADAEKKYKEALDFYTNYWDQLVATYSDKIEKANQQWRKDAEELGKNAAYLLPTNEDTFQSYSEGLQKLLDDLKKQQAVFGESRPQYEAAAKQWDDIGKQINKTREAMQKFNIAEKLTAKEKAKDPVAEKYEKQVNLLREATKAYQDYRKTMGSQAAEKKVQSTDRFADLGFTVEGFEGLIDEILSKLGDTKAQRKVADAAEKLIENWNRGMSQINFNDMVKKTNAALDKVEGQWERFQRMFDATGDFQYSIEIAFDGQQAFSSFADQLQWELSNAMSTAGLNVPITMDEQEAREIFGENGELFNLWKRTRDAVMGDVIEMENMIGEAIKKTLSGDDIVRSLNAQKNAALNKLAGEGFGMDSKEALSVAKLWDEKIADAMFEDFKKSDIWVKTFEDMERLSTSSIEQIIAELEKFKSAAGKDLPVEDFKTLMDTLNKLKKVANERNPFKSFIQSIKDMGEAKGKISDLKGEIEEINKTQVKGMDGWTIGMVMDSSLDEYTKKMAETQEVTLEYTNKAGQTVKKVITLAKAFKELGNAQDDVKDNEETMKVALSKMSDYAQIASNAIKGLSDVFDSLGNEDMANVSDNVSGVIDSFANIGQAFAKGGPIGAIGAAAGEALGWISKVFQQHDERLQKIIENSETAYKRLQNIYDQISRNIEFGLEYAGGAGNTSYIPGLQEDLDRLKEVKRLVADINTRKAEGKSGMFDMLKTYEYAKEIDKLEKRKQAASEGGAYGYQRQLMQEQLAELEKQRQAEIDKKKPDDDVIADYEAQIAEMKDSIAQFSEEVASEVFGIDFHEWAATIGDALFEAFAQGTDAAEAFDEAVNGIMADVVKNMAKMYILEPYFKRLREYLFGEDGKSGAFGTDFKLDETEMAGMMGIIGEIKDKAIPAYKEFFDAMNEAMGGALTAGQEASDLSKGIQSITEDTAQLLASYLNAIRQDVSIMRELTSQILTLMKQTNNNASLILAQLSQLNTTASAIRSAIESTITTGNSGRAMRVKIS